MNGEGRLGRDLFLSPDVMRHPFQDPGLAIRVMCSEKAWMERDFSETQVLVKIDPDYDHPTRSRVRSVLLHEV
jgi:hypothetical protein